MISWRRVVTLCAVAVLLTTLAFSGEASAAQSSLSRAERQVVRLVNAYRQARGLHPLRVSRALCRAAQRHSIHMQRHRYFGHVSPSGVSVAGRAVSCGYGRSGRAVWRVGEVIAWGSGRRGTPAAVVRGWLRSTPHRAVLLSRSWRHIGVGRVGGPFCGVADAAVYTVDFGLRR